MSQITGLQRFVEEMDAGTVTLTGATETSLNRLQLSEREKAIILSGQESLIRSVAEGRDSIDDVKLQFSPELMDRLNGEVFQY